MAEENIQQSTQVNRDVLIPVLLSFILYASDFIFKFDGLNIPRLVQGNTALQFFGQSVLAVVGALTILYLLLSGETRSKREIILASLLSFEVVIILTFGGFNIGVLLHLLIPWYLLSEFKSPSDTKDSITIKRITGYFIDFFGFGIVSMLIGNEILGNRLIIPIWVLYSIKKGYDYTSSEGGRKLLGALLVIIVVVYMGAFVDGMRILNETKRLGADQVRDFGEFVSDSLDNLKGLGEEVRININRTIYEITHPYDVIYNGDKEPSENPQGVFLEERELGTRDYTEGDTVYVWMKITAKSLEDPIEGEVICYTKSEGELISDVDDEVIRGIVNEDTGAKSLSLRAYSGYDRSIPCIFEDLDAGEYDIIYNVTFDFSAEARKKIYLMDRTRLINDLDLLESRGIEPTKENVLSQIYEIEDTDPESIVTTGPIKVSIETDSVPWDIGSTDNIKPLFGVTIENDWDRDGKIARIKDISFRMPQSFTFENPDRNCNIKLERSNSPPTGQNEYVLTGESADEDFLSDIEDFRTVNCHMTINPDQSLDPYQVTTRFLRTRVDYTYVMQEEISVNVEERETDYGDVSDRDICCEYEVGSSQGTTVFHRLMSSNECNEREGQQNIIRSEIVNSDFCES